MVSVIVPVYNAEKYINKCVDSILNQTYKDFELILIDDGSNDNSLELIKKYAVKDSRISLFSHENKGVSYTRNLGLDLAKGDYIMFIDSDDWIESDMLEVLIQNIEKSNADISCCQYDKNLRTDISSFEIWSREKFLSEFIMHKKINGSLVNKLIKREAISNIRFNDSIKYGEDALFLWKVLLNSNSICLTNKVLYHVVLHDDSASGGGSYKPIRKDCIEVWNLIVSDASSFSKELRDLAKAQLANMAFFSLYEMIYYNYNDIEHEKLYRKTLKEEYTYLQIAKFIPLKEKLFAIFIIFNIKFVRKIIMSKSKKR